jgi:hypothetical protein
MRGHRPRLLAVGVVFTVCILVQAAASQAQVTTSITSSALGTAVTPPPPGGTVFVITGGTRPAQGTNLPQLRQLQRGLRRYGPVQQHDAAIDDKQHHRQGHRR